MVPSRLTPKDLAKRDSLCVVARLKPGVTLERARAEMTFIANRLERQDPETNTKVGVLVVH